LLEPSVDRSADIAALRRAIHANEVLADEAIPIMAYAPRAASATALRGMRRLPTFLLIEDNPDDEALVARAFADANVAATIAVARDGEEALLWLRANPDVRFLLLDLNLPRMDGFDFLQAVRADPKTKHLPVVVFTSSLAQRDVERAYRLGATSYIQKPIEYAEFEATIKTILQYWLRANHPSRLSL
jgi:two-component system, response regulator